MSLVPYPASFLTTKVSKALQWPQSTLVGELTRARQVLLFGYPAWVGNVSIQLADYDAAADMQIWLAQMQRADTWTPIPLGVEAKLPVNTQLNVIVQAGVTGVVRVSANSGLLPVLTQRPYVSDGKQVRIINGAAPVAGQADQYDLRIWPISRPVAVGDVFAEVTTIDAYLGDVSPQYLTRDPDFVDPHIFPWQERVVA